MTTDKTGAPTEVTAEEDRFSIAVDGRKAGFTELVDHDGQRIFPHTEIGDDFEGRGLATILCSRPWSPPAKPACASCRCVRWWQASSRRTTSSTTSWTPSRPT